MTLFELFCRLGSLQLFLLFQCESDVIMLVVVLKQAGREQLQIVPNMIMKSDDQPAPACQV